MTLAQRVNNLREHLRYYHLRYKFILSLPKGSRVLDLGCGECIARRNILSFLHRRKQR